MRSKTLRTDPLVRAIALLELSPRRVLAAVAAGIATLGSALALAALSAWLITRAWQMPPVLDLTVAVVAVRALGISRGVFRYLERLATHDTALRGTTAIRERIYRTLAHGRPDAVAGLHRGDLLARTGADVDTLGDVVVRALIPIAVAIAMSLAAVGIVAPISIAGALILAAALLLAGVGAPLLAARAAAAAEHAGSAAATEYSASALLALDHGAELRVAGWLDGALARADRDQRAYVAAVDRAARPAAWASAATPLAIGAAVLGALLVGISLYAGGTMSPMSLAILVLVPLAAFEATGVLPDAAVQLTRSRLAASRIMALLDAAGPEDLRPGRPVESAHLTAEDLVWGWPGGPELATPLGLSAESGARIAVTGPSGAGKSTLLMTLAGLLEPLGGRVLLAGRAVDEYDESGLRRAVGFFAEDAHIFETTVRENLRVARGDATDAEMLAALDAVGAGDWLAELPEGLDTTLDGGAAAVSGGQRRRLLLARAILSPARVLLLDEPTEHLDASAGEALLRALLDRGSGLLAAERTVILVTHQLPAGTAADQVIEVAALTT
ncbi:thiol reductant ABC exporter subunit CydC [Tomitella biformata]|uniref:thiol reductant ABC exporter subunit CydC n=1 Tax=Tomitella biformata TaxID=630403 RepID=UPI000466D9B6|nr:thiol reductant ABC exporter subunit CydC [Tomitella biformata]